MILLGDCVTNAGYISVLGDSGNGQIGADGSIAGIGIQKDRVGTGGDNERGLALIYFFELPTFSSLTTITNAELQIEYVEIETSSGPPDFNIDLLGIDVRPSSIFDASDYYDGIATLSSDTLIQASTLIPTTVPGNISIANLSLLNFVKSLYNADGTPISTFATFRVNADIDLPPGSGPIRGYWMALADNANDSFRPRLNLTGDVIPEPSTFTLITCALFGLVGYGSRRRFT